MNHTSSRSHTIFRLKIQSLSSNFIKKYRQEKREIASNINNNSLLNALSSEAFNFSYFRNSEDEGTVVTEALLNFVDLAGSEKVSHHWNEETEQITNFKAKDRVKEGQYINKSLFFLMQVISMRAKETNKFKKKLILI